MSIPAAELRLVDSIHRELCCCVQDTFFTQCVPSVTADRRCVVSQLRPRRNSSLPFLLIQLAIFSVSLIIPKAQMLCCGNIQGSGLECPFVDFSFYTTILNKLIIYPCVYKYHFMYTISDCSSWYQLASLQTSISCCWLNILATILHQTIKEEVSFTGHFT